MVAKAETEASSKLDTVKLFFAVLLLVAGIAGFYHFAEESLLYRVLGLVALIGVAVGVVYTTRIGRSVAGFARDSRAEVRKVVWPTRQETLQTTLMVVVAVILIGIFLWLVDTLLLWAVEILTGRG